MLSLGRGSGSKDNAGNDNAQSGGSASKHDEDSSNTTAGASDKNTSGSTLRASSRPPSAASNTSSSLRGRSRSPSSAGSPLFHRRATGTGIGRIESPSQLPTIPSASNIHGSYPDAFDNYNNLSSSPLSSSALYMNGGHHESSSGFKTRSSSLAATGSAPRNIPGQGLPDPIGTGSPREGSRLYERGGTSVSSSFGAGGGTSTSLFSSSFPSSGGIWSNDPKPSSNTGINPSMPPPTSANPIRTSLSRHLSLSGNFPKTATGGAPLPSPSRAASGWPDSPLSVEDVALSSSGDFRQGRSRTRMYANSPVGSGGNNTPSAFGNTGADATPSGQSTNNLARSLSIASDRTASSVGGAGIAISNMSPFVRDTRGLPPVLLAGSGYASRGTAGNGPASAHPYSSSFSTTHDFFQSHRGPNSAIGEAFGGGLSGYNSTLERTQPVNHGAVGSGRTASMAAPLSRKRRENLWGDDRAFREGDEHAFYEAEDDEEDYAPPTRSGATSRRHSVAAFTSTSTLTALTSPPAVRSLVGFQVPGDTPPASDSQQGRISSTFARKNGTSGGATFSIGGDSRLDDEDLLATDLSNTLQINLEAHAARQRQAEEQESQSHQQQTRVAPPPARLGYDSRSSSMPVQAGAHSDRSQQQQTSPFGSLQLGQQLPAALGTSPPAVANKPAGSGHDRRASASGDPYSPSASAARFLATAHNVQPPPFQPQTSISQQRQQANPPQQSMGISPEQGDAARWPPSGTGLFAHHQQSPNFRSGALPSPDQVRSYAAGQPRPFETSASPAAGLAPPGPYNFMSGPGAGRGVSPGASQPDRLTSPPSSLGFLPPFAGFPAASQVSGPPPPSLSPMNASAQPYFVPPIAPQPNLNDLGRGVPLHALPADGPLYIVEFKAGRTDLFYVEDAQHLTLQKGDLVVVEADRGKDLGKCLTSCTLDEVRDFQMHQVESALGQLAANAGGGATIGGVATLPPDQQPSAAAIARMTKEIHPKKIYGLASPADVALLAVKAADEQKALNVCRAKVLQHQLPMEVTDAEFQFDRRRLTFFYIADRRIDFRNLVKDLFRLYKTRIWLCAIDNGVIQR